MACHFPNYGHQTEASKIASCTGVWTRFVVTVLWSSTSLSQLFCMARLVLSVNISNMNRRWVLTSCSDGRPVASVVVCTPERRDPRPRQSALSKPNNSDNSASVIDFSVIQTTLYGLSVVHWHLCNLCGWVLPLLATRSSSPLAWRVCSILHTRSSEIVRSYSAEGLWIHKRVFRETMRVFEFMRWSCEFMRGPCDFITRSCEFMRESCKLTGESWVFRRWYCEFSSVSCKFVRGSCHLSSGSCEFIIVSSKEGLMSSWEDLVRC